VTSERDVSRVLMTADAVGGVWTYALELARALAPHGIQTTLAVLGPSPTDDQLSAAADVPGLDLHAAPFQLEWMPDGWDDVRKSGEWLLQLAADAAPDVVHLNGYAHALLPWPAPAVVVGHSCVCSWSDAVGGGCDPAWLARYRDVVSAALDAAEWVVAPTGAMLGALRRHYGPLPRASVVPNGRDASRFRIGPKERLVLTAGRLWDRAKNVDAVRAVAGRLSWRVDVAGETAIGVGRLSPEAVADQLSRAAIFALPARYEPFGLLPLEAALSGCALVLGDIPSLREVWGDAAIYVDPDDRDRLQASLQRLIRDAHQLRHFAAQAWRRALTYTPARMADAYRAIYRAQARAFDSAAARLAPVAAGLRHG
jgi:glycosyltransferase involved in cell wall biosynthesis